MLNIAVFKNTFSRKKFKFDICEVITLIKHLLIFFLINIIFSSLFVLILIPCGFCQLKIHHQITHRTVDVATIALHEGIVRGIN